VHSIFMDLRHMDSIVLCIVGIVATSKATIFEIGNLKQELELLARLRYNTKYDNMT
jgi:hypothetical protein